MTIDIGSGRPQNSLVSTLYNCILNQSSLTLKLLSEVGSVTEADGGTVVSASWHSAVPVNGPDDFVDASSAPLSLDYEGIANNRTYTFAPVTGQSQSVQGVGLYSGSTCLVVWPTSSNLLIGERATFLPGSLRISIDGLPLTYTPT